MGCGSRGGGVGCSGGAAGVGAPCSEDAAGRRMQGRGEVGMRQGWGTWGAAGVGYVGCGRGEVRWRVREGWGRGVRGVRCGGDVVGGAAGQA